MKSELNIVRLNNGESIIFWVLQYKTDNLSYKIKAYFKIWNEIKINKMYAYSQYWIDIIGIHLTILKY